MGKIPKVLSIAGSDSGGGAGIQADLKTFTCLKSYGTTVLTALTAQNTQGVNSIMNVPIKFIKEQFDTVTEDIEIDAVKIGMLGSTDIINTVADKLKHFKCQNIILDPVMVSTSGSRLLEENSIETLKDKLLPLALLITPNIDEAEILTGIKISSLEYMKEACKSLYSLGCKNVLLKGGHLPLDENLDKCSMEKAQYVVDILYDGSKFYEIKHDYIITSNTHGSGCTLSSAITSFIGHGCSVLEAIENGIKFTQNAIKEAFPVGKGNGPLNHFHSKIQF